jgi:hypothetical protein
VHFFDANGLPGEDRAEIDFFLTQTDATAMRNHNGSVVERIVDVGQTLVDARRWPIDLGRTFHLQSFVRTFVVEDIDELVEASLLLKEIGGGWLGSFFFQSEMHAFMPTVLLGMPGLDPFDADAQPKPPDRQFA